MTTALLITTTGEARPVQLPQEGSHLVLNELCGGWLDCVRNDEMKVVGYVHDEGLLIGLDPNVVASALFGRPLVGNCVIVGAVNERGFYDGENHDIPEQFLTDGFREYAERIASDESLVELVKSVIQEMDFTPTVVSMSDEQFSKWLDGEEA